jgi:uncharacterized protein (TIGR03067 family)
MKARYLGIPFVGLALAAGVAAEDTGKADLKRLEGTWRMTSVEIDGKKIPPDDLKPMSVVFRGDTYTVKNDDKEVEKGTQKLDPSQTPKTIDAHVVEGSDKGKDQLGIYELSGDTLKVCFAAAGQERPKEFASKPGSKHEFGIFQRQKP